MTMILFLFQVYRSLFYVGPVDSKLLRVQVIAKDPFY